MSLFGALTSGVSGLVAQSSGMSAIADNITNVNTVGYKNVQVDFQTLVTKQTSVTFYSAGGVQSRPKQQNDVQGLLQSTTSQTDVGVSGAGFFVVNESNRPIINNQFLFTRSGSFFQDNEGFLRNTGGFYLQAWPTDASGQVILPTGSTAGLTNQNIISTDFLETVNLARVRGSAAETQNIAIGANLPANDAVGSTHKTDVQFFDTLGNATDVSFVYTKLAANQWDLTIEPPTNTTVLTVFDSAGTVHRSIGQLEFTAVPAAFSSVIVGGTTYTFVNGATGAADDQVQVDGGRTITQIVADLVAEINADLAGTPAAAKAGNLQTLLITGAAADIIVNPNANAAVRQTATFTVQDHDNSNAAIIFNSDGLPSAFNVANMSILDFGGAAADMNNVDLDGDGIVDVNRIALDFGTIGEADGMTQFGAEFTPTFIQQDGARFGVFAGVSIATDGLMTALFDNGELRTIFQIPVATFVNPNGLESRTGNVWNSTERSGDPTLRVADNGPAGQIIQATLEASTVDIGEEFTDMIIVQRAYTAATRIISTTDRMLEELVNVKR